MGLFELVVGDRDGLLVQIQAIVRGYLNLGVAIVVMRRQRDLGSAAVHHAGVHLLHAVAVAREKAGDDAGLRIDVAVRAPRVVGMGSALAVAIDHANGAAEGSIMDQPNSMVCLLYTSPSPRDRQK